MPKSKANAEGLPVFAQQAVGSRRGRQFRTKRLLWARAAAGSELEKTWSESTQRRAPILDSALRGVIA